jgi:hypothetical protein
LHLHESKKSEISVALTKTEVFVSGIAKRTAEFWLSGDYKGNALLAEGMSATEVEREAVTRVEAFVAHPAFEFLQKTALPFHIFLLLHQ